ncbi:Molybdate transporter 1 [Rhynchospora pubera]|uniref:Molybdate transporter 1 n=1 Tax=Rhynchospora pubera TaxID=906938 RepID=A0AAV8GMD8_9POAL|nr:Molybdate transporter 1 [Rhynchospora pubera]
MPVQPMKSIAAVAISNKSFGVPEIMAAGIITSGVAVVLGVTGLMELAYWLIPLSVVRGIQLAQGLNFAMTAVKYIRKEQDLGKGKSTGQRPWTGLDGLILAIVACCFIVLVNGAGKEIQRQNQHERNEQQSEDETHNEANLNPTVRRSKKFLEKLADAMPSAVIVFLLGLILAVIRKPSAVKELRAGPETIRVVHISRHAWRDGFIKGAIPQLPLTLLNSVIAVCKLSKDLFPEKQVRATSVSVTVGLMNLIGCWFGSMPCCHGAGGLAGQYKFGGRSGGCVAALGALKLVLGLVLGGSMLRVLVEFPVGLLGVLLLFAGVELAMAARDMSTKQEAFVMLVVTSVSLVGSSAALGFPEKINTNVTVHINFDNNRKK